MWYSLSEFFLENRARVAYVMSLGVVAVLCFMLYILGKNSVLDVANLHGIIGSNSTSSLYHTAETLELTGKDLSGSIGSAYSDDAILIDISLSTSNDKKIVLIYDQNNVNFLEFKQFQDRSRELSVNTNEIQFKHTGENNYKLTFKRETSFISPVFLKIYSSDVLIQQYKLFGTMDNGNLE